MLLANSLTCLSAALGFFLEVDHLSKSQVLLQFRRDDGTTVQVGMANVPVYYITVCSHGNNCDWYKCSTVTPLWNEDSIMV